MKKKILMGTFLLGISLFGILSISAANNRVQIVSENYTAKQLSPDGTHIFNTINTEKTDLVNGNVAIDIIINNSKNAEIFYAIDNSSSMESIKSNVIDNIKTGAATLEGLVNIKQGIVSTNEGNISTIALDSANIEMQLDTVKTYASTGNNQIFELIDKAAENFTNAAEIKVIVVNAANFPDISPEEKESFIARMKKHIDKGIKIIAYDIYTGTGIGGKSITAIYEELSDYAGYNIGELLTRDTIKDMNFLTNVMSYLPSAKPAIATTITYDNYIINNFEIKDVVADKGTARYEASTNRVLWEIDTIPQNQIVKLTYYLSLKTTVDESIIDTINLRTNRQIVVTQTGEEIGTYPDHDQIDDQICSPTIRILREAIDNPKTGMIDYIIGGSCMLAVALITIVILNRKNEFNRI